MTVAQEQTKQQRHSSSSRSPFPSVSLLVILLILLSTLLSPVQADTRYSFLVPTAATLWTPGQAGVITITSNDKATATTKPTDRLLTITLRKSTSLITSKQVAVIQDRLQLLVPVGSPQEEVSTTISDWIVPNNLPPGSGYFVRLDRAKVSVIDLIPLSADSPSFQIVAPVVPPVPSASGLPTATAQPTTNSTIPPTMTTTTAPTPTATLSLPPGTTCDDIRQQCAAQSLTFVDTNQSALCHCGVPLILPNIVGSHGGSSLQKIDSSMMARLFSIVVLTHLFVPALMA